MTENESRPPLDNLFAAKGAAAPSPAVGYVSVRQLEGRPESGGQDGTAGDTGSRFGIPGFDERTWKGAPADKPAPDGSSSPLAALISRGAGAKPSIVRSPRGLLDDTRRAPALAAGPEPATHHTLIDPQRVLSTPGGLNGGHGAPRRAAKRPDMREKSNAPKPAPEPAPLPPNPNAPWAKPGEAPPAAPAPRARRASRATPRKPLTVRLELAQYARLRDRAARSGATLQSLLAGAVAVYLESTA